VGVKADGAWGWQLHHLHVPNVMEIWEPKTPGTLWATPGLLRDCFIIFLITRLREKRLAWSTAVCQSCSHHWHIQEQVTVLSQQRTPWLITSSIFLFSMEWRRRRQSIEWLHCRLGTQHFRSAGGAFHTNDTSLLSV